MTSMRLFVHPLPTAFRLRPWAALLVCAALLSPAAQAQTGEPAAEATRQEGAEAETTGAAPATTVATGAGTASDLVHLEVIPAPDFSVYEPAVADQLRQVQATLALLVDRAQSDNPPLPSDLSASFGDLGRHYHAYGLLDSARASYANATLLSRDDPRWPHLLGRAQQDAGHLEEAAAAYERSLELTPDNVPALIYLAEIHVLEGEAAEAQALYRRALALQPTASAALAGLGEAALEAEQPARAVELLEAALEANPDANRLHHPLGLAYRALGDDAAARANLEAAGTVGIRTDDPLVNGLEDLKSGERVHLLRGHMAYRAGHFAEAANAYHRASEANPESVAAQVDLATALSQIGYLEGAEEHLREALALDSENANVHYNLGSLLLASGQTSGAELHLRRAVSLAPEDAAAVVALANLLAGRDPQTAMDLYRQAQGQPGTGSGASAEAYLGEVQLLLGAEMYGRAVERAEAGFAAVPSSVGLLGTLARLLAASPDLEVRDGERALTLAESFFAAGQSLASGETYALALAESGRCDEAAEWQGKLIQFATQQGAESLVPALNATLERYEAGAPCRPPSAASPSTVADGGGSGGAAVTGSPTPGPTPGEGSP